MMDHEILMLFSLEEFTDLSHGMTAKSKRKVDIPKDENWEDTNQQTRHGEAIASSKNAIALQTPKPINSKDFLNHATIHIVR